MLSMLVIESSRARQARCADRPGVVAGVVAGEEIPHRVDEVRDIDRAAVGHNGDALVPCPRPGDGLGNVQRDVKVRLDAVVVAAAVHAGVAVLCVFVYALYIERVQILVDGQRDRLADGVLRTAADGLFDELFRHAGDLAPGVPVVVQPASVQNLRIIVPGCQCRMIDAADSGRDGRGRVTVFGSRAAAHLLGQFDVMDLGRESGCKIVYHRIGDKVCVRRFGIHKPAQLDALRRARRVGAAFLRYRDRNVTGTHAGH